MTLRAQVSLTAEQHALLVELSELRGQSISAIIGELVDQASPGWQAELPKLRRLRSAEERLQREMAALRK